MAVCTIRQTIEITGLGGDKKLSRRFDTTLAPVRVEGPSYYPILSTSVTYISSLVLISVENITGVFMVARQGELSICVSSDVQSVTVGTPEFARIALNSGEATYLNFYAGITVAKSLACWGMNSAILEFIVIGTNS